MHNKYGRPYVGIVISIKGVDFFAPLKSAGSNKKPNSQLSTKILDESDSSNKLVMSYIIQQNMVPIPNKKGIVIKYNAILNSNYSKIKNSDRIRSINFA